ncbi:hypothetical protein [Ralstonia phage RP31]|uniref:Ryanodine receptor Ryr domain-containing protein n=1 Tax=Ralstonia phage RP31 TaxID=1923890 RepID=A0A1L7N1G2_9CAUD|nr:hypothetical protein [Ralstonia phage RP31]
MNKEDIARVCHETNRAYCESQGDHSLVAWEDSADWQKKSMRLGVEFHLSGDHGPEASHVNWMKQKEQDGWTYGPVKDEIKKEHPCMVPFNQLPVSQQAKDFIVRSVVHSLKPYLTE